jgi:cell division ATPase FtsA
MVTGAASAAQNIVKCVQRCGLEVEDIVLEQLASSHAVLTDDEKELGAALVDIGGGTTDIAVFHDGAIKHTAVIPIAGDQVTNDIAVALRTPTQYANDLKIKYACALRQLATDNETIEVPSVGDREPRRLARQTLAEVVEPRYEELLSLVQAELRRSGFEEICAAGVVLTGGSSKMEGAIELAEEIKIKYACALSQLANTDETIEVPSVGDRPPRRLARQTLGEVVEPRYEELFTLISNELRRSGFEEMIAAGIVITGGSSKMEGAVDLAEEVFHMPVRLGMPQYVRGLGEIVRNPIHATGVGILLYAQNKGEEQAAETTVRGNVREIWDRMKTWFQGNF